MSEKTIKYEWRRRWEQARDRERTACVSCDWHAAREWARVALGIEMAFSVHFGQDFGAYLCEVMG